MSKINKINKDILGFEDINVDLKTEFIGRNIVHFDSIDSTNAYAKTIGDDCPDGTAVTCEVQTMGRGRLGRQWKTVSNSMCMTIILKPEINLAQVSKTTQVCAAAVSLALEEFNIETEIKWPNDLMINNKKICGILTEMKTEGNKISYVIVGMGLNVNNSKEDFNEEIRDIATSIFIETGINIKRSSLAAKIMNNFEELYMDFINGNFQRSLDICRNKSNVIGKYINLIHKNSMKKAKAVDLGPDGELIVQYENGEIDSIISGEISARTI